MSGLKWALNLAPIGAQCTVPGFSAWTRVWGGWRNSESGVELGSDQLASHIETVETPDRQKGSDS